MTTADLPLTTDREDLCLSGLARGLVGSEVLKIAGEVRAMKASGRAIADLTVGDFSPSEFRIPTRLRELIEEALAAGQTNYPPSDGTMELRKAVIEFFGRELGLVYPLESTLIAGGARPIIYAAYAAVVDPGDKVVYPTPSWNNNHYTYLMRGVPVELVVGPETNFLPTAEQLRPHIRDARLIAINTPLNPTGTVMAREEVERIARLVVDENRRRAAAGERALFLMWDQVYWMLTFGQNRHFAPPQLVPESAAWTIFVDGISKAFAATGLRVGWTVAPPYVTARMRDIIGHIGAWAPRAEQIATARFLGERDAIAAFHDNMIRELQLRLDLLHDGIESMRRDGLPVRAIAPQGAIYLSVQFDLIGRPGLTCNEEIRRLLLEKAGFAVVPFQAFGLKQDTGWFRLSAGAVSLQDIEAGLGRVRGALEGL
ncbi:MAG TPA: aminotransferase class I/II-fold pyridoxal phosphate-dependent enzyme [Thermoanaerobaculia bacterium]|nr:aminotransferase class I/II-fold pyridoxal phosphate-dependent enzyme [Thermoanaerobaculia bacterium]